jgi:alpha-aminoadipic semialdehyde synthase
MSEQHVHKVNFLPGFSFEGFANRDSILYKTLYGIPEAHTILRGTLRYTGFADTMRGLIKLGLVDPNPHPALHPKGPEITWVKIIMKLMTPQVPFKDSRKSITTARSNF